MKRMQNSMSKVAVWLVLATSPGVLPQGVAQTKADNTAVNKRDKEPGEVTAGSQKSNKSDTHLTADIRKAIVADKSLSTYAHNVKVISRDGTVTLKGPVHSDDEVSTIMAKAAEVTGDKSKIVNQLTVKK